ncbi:MAG: 2TM domain-containing protein [Promethearchaeota archaeon]|nr:MAG: 2TM domain-containing protein [Candidatus Lokiarchaeota archaeon]
MSVENGFSEETLRKIAAQKVTFRYTVKIHLFCYVFVNLILFSINAIVSANNWWAFYPLLGWLIGLAIHATVYWTWSRGINYGRRAIIFNFVAWVFGVLLLTVIDFMTAGYFSWVVYPTGFWGLGILVHIIIYALIAKRQQVGDSTKVSKKDRAIEHEMQKLREKQQKAAQG